MLRVLRTYARRFRFAHPTTADFIATVNEVTGQDWQWFFERDLLLERPVRLRRLRSTPARRARPPAGSRARTGSSLYRAPAARRDDADGGSRVTIVRHGEVRMPVELRVELEGGRVVEERWDGQARWKRFEYPAKVVRAVVDPRHTLAIDVDPVNNEWIAPEGPAATRLDEVGRALPALAAGAARAEHGAGVSGHAPLASGTASALSPATTGSCCWCWPPTWPSRSCSRSRSRASCSRTSRTRARRAR